MDTRQKLRQQLLQQRRGLNPQIQQTAAHHVAEQIIHSTFFHRSQRIAFYLPINGELDPQPLIQHARQLGKICCVPLLHPLKRNRLLFTPYEPDDILVRNRFGILEPSLQQHKIIPAWTLDLVLMPLIGFDINGNRLGTGGGFYDRTFAFLQRREKSSRPYLVGLAYEFQKINQFKAEIWDVPLSAIVTEKRIITVARKENL